MIIVRELVKFLGNNIHIVNIYLGISTIVAIFDGVFFIYFRILRATFVNKEDSKSDDEKALELSKKLEATNQKLRDSIDAVKKSTSENADESDASLDDDNSKPNAYNVVRITKELDEVTAEIKEVIKVVDD